MAEKPDLVHYLLPITQDEYNRALNSLVTERVYQDRAADATRKQAAAAEIIAIETAAAESAKAEKAPEEPARKKPAATPSTRK